MQSITRTSAPSIRRGQCGKSVTRAASKTIGSRDGVQRGSSRKTEAQAGDEGPQRARVHSNDPMRFRLLKFIQMKNARPTTLASGTKPQ